ncbi:MAG: VOC family protein [Solirubrobacterales bacterium]|nr:VOC family protein [Solirubrobacterales bacterium]
MSTISPIIPYADPRAAIDFLCDAFGFERHAVHEGPDGELGHVELRLGDAVLMPAPQRHGEPGHACCYVAVEDADAHHDRARAAGAEITMQLRDTDYGSRDYAAKDPEGNTWYFGTYRPLA